MTTSNRGGSKREFFSTSAGNNNGRRSFDLVEAQEVEAPELNLAETVATTTSTQARNTHQLSPDLPNDYFDVTSGWLIMWGTLLLGLIVMAACVAESFHYVNYNEYALLQDVYGDVRLSKVYGEGRYFFPLNYDMLKFPSTYKDVSFEVDVFSDTGLEFSVDIQFYYRIPEDNLGAIYDSFSNNYHDRVISNAQTTIKNVAAPLNINIYLTNRTYVQELFANAINKVLSEVVMVDAPTLLFRIGEVELPSSVISRSLDSAIAIQRNEILANTQEVVVIRAETSKLVADIDAGTNQVLNFAKNTAERLIQDSRSYARQVDIRARGLGIAGLINTMNFTTSNKTMAIVNRLAQIDNAANTRYVTAGASLLEVSV